MDSVSSLKVQYVRGMTDIDSCKMRPLPSVNILK